MAIPVAPAMPIPPSTSSNSNEPPLLPPPPVAKKDNKEEQKVERLDSYSAITNMAAPACDVPHTHHEDSSSIPMHLASCINICKTRA